MRGRANVAKFVSDLYHRRDRSRLAENLQAGPRSRLELLNKWGSGVSVGVQAITAHKI